MAAEPPDQTLQPTALVHEAYLRLIGLADLRRWENRGHFFTAAAEAMRRILVEAARRKKAAKHGGGRYRHDANDLPIAAPPVDDNLIALDEALNRFAQVEPQKAELVKLRYFVGLTIEETAAALGISLATAKRQWAYSKAWLFQAMEGGEKNSENP
jgi:RNA polymerase sigma factor (TIGR02999 family)